MQTPSEHALHHRAAEGKEVDVALSRSTLYAALALGFRPPTRETVDRLVDATAVAALADAARMLERCIGVAGLANRVEAQRAVPLLDVLAADYRRLFGHTARGEAPPYETEYGDEALFQQSQELADIAGFMRAFGLMLRPEAHERIDHVSCECEFLAFLACKEAYAIYHEDAEMSAATARATTLFLHDHLGRFAPAFARRLERLDAGGFYGVLGGVLLGLVKLDCQRLDCPLGPEHLTLRPDPVTCAVPLGCGVDEDGGGCGASPGPS